MKTLLLLRHAKSSWDNAGLTDYNRPLNDRGRRDAPRMGKLIRREGLTPNLMLSSSAKRAATTAELVALEFSLTSEIRYTESLYLAEPETYIVLARQVSDDIESIMMVGHNPGIQELVEWLTGQDERMATATLAYIRAPIQKWSELAGGKQYELAGIWRPREL
jgi:phosphohistidine phosphatase